MRANGLREARSDHLRSERSRRCGEGGAAVSLLCMRVFGDGIRAQHLDLRDSVSKSER